MLSTISAFLLGRAASLSFCCGIAGSQGIMYHFRVFFALLAALMLAGAMQASGTLLLPLLEFLIPSHQNLSALTLSLQLPLHVVLLVAHSRAALPCDSIEMLPEPSAITALPLRLLVCM